MYKCNKCNYVTNFTSHYEKHMSSNKHKVHICNKCNKTYKTRSGLWKHNKKCIATEPVAPEALFTDEAANDEKSNQEVIQRDIDFMNLIDM